MLVILLKYLNNHLSLCLKKIEWIIGAFKLVAIGAILINEKIKTQQERLRETQNDYPKRI